MTNFFVLENLAMGANIAPTSYNSNPDKKAVVVDVYASPAQKPVNNLPTTVDNAKIEKALTPQMQSVSNVLGALVDAAAQQGSKKETIERMVGVVGLYRSDIETIVGPTANILFKEFGLIGDTLAKDIKSFTNGVGGSPFVKAMASGIQKIKVTIDGVEKLVETVDFKGLEKLGKMINNLVDGDDLFNIFRQSDTQAVIRSISQLMKEYGLPNIIDHLIGSFSPQQQKEILIGSATDVASITDIATLNKMIDIVGAKDLLNANPYLIRDFLYNFTGDSVYSEPLSETTWDAIDDVLKRLYSHWGYRYIYGKEGNAIDLDLFKEATDFIKKCLIYNDKFSAAISLMGKYSNEPFTVGARRGYPWVSFEV